jgi:tetratricopeptide (TPR) repeat protein
MPDTATISEPVETTAPKNRKWLFTLLAYSIPFIFFIGLELGLRLFGYGEDYPLFMPFKQNPDFMYQNEAVAKRYFTMDVAIPNSNVDFFRKVKEKGTIRIVVQGESSAAGYPFYRGGGFSRMLEQRLNATFPQQKFEVINTAMAAVSSYTLLDFADEILDIKPDIVLIYTGHNEYYGALGVGSSESLGYFRGLVNLYLRFKDYRTVQLLRNALIHVAGWFGKKEDPSAPSVTLMERMVGEQSIAYGSSLYEAGKTQFMGNMHDLLAKYKAAGVPVFMSTLASNESDHSPFISSLAPSTDKASWNALKEQINQALSQNNIQALALTQKLVQMDTTSATAFYLRGKALEQFADTTQADAFRHARKMYLKAKDLDQLRFRAPEQINQMIRSLAQEFSLPIVEGQSYLAKACKHGIISNEVMTEHLHPNMEGYLHLADAFYASLIQNYTFQSPSQLVPLASARQMILFTTLDSLKAQYHIKQLTSSWPFKPYGTIDRSLADLEGKNDTEKLALKLFRKQIRWYPATVQTIEAFEKAGMLNHALQNAVALTDSYKPLPEPWYLCARLYMKLGAVPQAKHAFDVAVALAPTNDAAHDLYLAMGNDLVTANKPNDAIGLFEGALRRKDSFEALGMLGSLYLNRAQQQQNASDVSQAISMLERARSMKPQDKQVLYNLAGGYATIGEMGKAKSVAQELLRIAPNDPNALGLLAKIGG